MRDIKLVVFHHTGVPTQNQSVKGIEEAHLARGFDKIGYHYIVDFEGTIHEGRKESEVGAHAKGFNTPSLGICCFGAYGLNNLQAVSLLVLADTLAKKYKLSPWDFLRHKDLARTLCPAYDIDWLKQKL